MRIAIEAGDYDSARLALMSHADAYARVKGNNSFTPSQQESAKAGLGMTYRLFEEWLLEGLNQESRKEQLHVLFWIGNSLRSVAEESTSLDVAVRRTIGMAWEQLAPFEDDDFRSYSEIKAAAG